ncbi:beta-1,3-galactosyltransferase 1-like protein, partial [Aphelenchoides avenae]
MVLQRFFIGATDPSIVEQLEKEQRKFGDLVFYDLPDEYENLYLKVHVIFQWQQEFCAQAQFVQKTDDDTTVHIPRLLHHIAQRFKPAMNGTKAVFGYLWTSAPVERYGKWGVSRNVFAPDLYPTYCNGPSYLVSNDAVAAILTRTPFEKAFKFEDVFYSGIVAEKAGVQKVAQGDVFYRDEN